MAMSDHVLPGEIDTHLCNSEYQVHEVQDEGWIGPHRETSECSGQVGPTQTNGGEHDVS